MKTRLPSSGQMRIAIPLLLLGTLLIACGAASRTNSTAGRASGAVSNAPPVELEIPKSVFVVPATEKEGKDPFFPRSKRPFATAPVSVPSNAPPMVVPVDLKINGTSGSEDRPLVIINNVTFGVGDKREVVSGSARVLLQCLEIDLAAGKATIEVAGNRRVLFFQKPGK